MLAFFPPSVSLHPSLSLPSCLSLNKLLKNMCFQKGTGGGGKQLSTINAKTNASSKKGTHHERSLISYKMSGRKCEQYVIFTCLLCGELKVNRARACARASERDRQRESRASTERHGDATESIKANSSRINSIKQGNARRKRHLPQQ